jgi:hypothetical protein
MEVGNCFYKQLHGDNACLVQLCKKPAVYLGTSSAMWEIKVIEQWQEIIDIEG